MDSFLPLFYEVLKLLGVKNPSDDMLFPFVIVLAFGFVLGGISMYVLLKISMLEKENNELNQKLNNVKKESDKSNEIEKDIKEEKQDNVEMNDNVVNKEEKQGNEVQKENKVKKKNKGGGIKPDPNFKRPENIDKKVEIEGEWSVVGKKKKKVKNE
jgi:hypothetical protein